MTKTILITDSCCDLPRALVREHGIVALPFHYLLKGVEHDDDWGATISVVEFYRQLESGEHVTTSQVALSAYAEVFERVVAAGQEAVVITFSSALSGGHEAAVLAREQVVEAHPEARIHIVDSLCACTGQGLLVLETAKRLEAGMGAEEAARFAEQARGRVNHVFTVDSFEHLVAGGRVSPAIAMAGTMLNIKPVMRMDAGGHLVPLAKPRGRHRAITMIADITAERIEDAAGQTIAVAQGDCPEDAALLRDLIVERTGARDVLMTHVGAVIGAHTGAGVLSAFFWGKVRE